VRHDALLLLGPTGSGKSPLGDHLEGVGWRGRPCRHLDFGATLRAVADGRLRPAALTDTDVALVRRMLATGALLEDQQLPIAAAILADFLERRAVEKGDLVVLNGLPRHERQAEAVEGWLDVREALHLRADADTLVARIRRHAHDERSGREDDTEEAVRGRLARFEARTAPLLARYADRLRTVDVGLATGPEDVLRALSGD